MGGIRRISVRKSQYRNDVILAYMMDSFRDWQAAVSRLERSPGALHADLRAHLSTRYQDRTGLTDLFSGYGDP